MKQVLFRISTDIRYFCTELGCYSSLIPRILALWVSTEVFLAVCTSVIETQFSVVEHLKDFLWDASHSTPVSPNISSERTCYIIVIISHWV